MNNSKDAWLVKDSSGKSRGPYNTKAVLSLIEKGVLTGTEQIAGFPGGDFQSISQVSLFYDKFLDVWEKEVGQLSEEEKSAAFDEADRRASSSSDDFEEPSVSNVSGVEIEINQNTQFEIQGDEQDVSQSEFVPPVDDSDAESISFVDNVSNVDADENTYNPADDSAYGYVEKQGSYNRGDKDPFSKTNAIDKTRPGLAEPKKKVYERVDDRSKSKRSGGNLGFKLLATFLAVLVALLLYDDHPAEKIRAGKNIKLKAISLSKKRQKASTRDLLKVKKQALDLIAKDNFSSYFESMNLLTGSMKKYGPDAESIGLLCTVYNELWKYTKRSSADIAAVSRATQLVSRINIGGVSTSNCRAIQFSLAGNLTSAEQVIDSALVNFPNTATFYDLKGEIQYIRGDRLTALAYFEKATSLWPNWKKPLFWQANLKKLEGNYEYAENIYRAILKPDFHRLAAIELAEVLVFNRGNYQDAGELLDKAVTDEVRVPRVWESKAFYILSVLARQQGNIEQATAYIKKSYELDTNNQVAKALLIEIAGPQVLSTLYKTETELMDNGDLFFKKRDYLAAQAEYKAAFDLDASNTTAGIMAAESLWRLNQGDEAIRWLQNVVKKNPKNLDALLMLSKFQVERYDFESAAKHLSRAKSIGKKDYRIFRGYAHFEFQRNNFVAAKKFAEQAIKIYDTDIDSHIVLAKVMSQLGSYDQAYKTIARAIGLEPSNVEAQTVYAEVLSQFQSVDSGVRYINNLINTYPSKMEFRVALARIYMLDGQWSNAVAVLKPVTEVRSEFKPAFMLLAKAYLGLQDATGALESYLGAASLDPTDAQPLVEIGQMYLATGKPSKAIRQFERAKKVNPRYPRIYYYLGQAYLQMGNAKSALEAALKERQKNPMIADSYMLAADSYRKLKKYNQAISEYQQAVQRRPQSAEIYVKLAICYRLIGNLDVAEQMLSTAQSKESGYPDIYKEIGAILEKKGKALEAIEAYRRYLSLKPNAKDADIVRIRIQQLGG